MNFTIPQLTPVSTPAADHYFELGGALSGSNKILASVFVLTTDSRFNGATVSSVQASGGITGLGFSGGPITTSGTLTLNGILAVGSGGSGTASPALVAGNSINLSGSWPGQTVALSSTPNIGSATGIGTVLTRNDGQYHHTLVRSSAFARSYGLGINSGTGEFILDDITANATRFRIAPSGTATIAGGLENTPIGASTPAGAAFTNLSATGATFTRNDGLYHATLTRTSAFARSYGLAINSGTGEFILDDITAGATRLRVSPAGALTVAGGVVAALTGNATTATTLATARTINGVAFDGSGNITLTGTNSTVIANLNRAAIRLLDVPDDKTTVFEQGYAFTNDGGGGIWIFNRDDGTSVDNDGTLVVPRSNYGDLAYTSIASITRTGTTVTIDTVLPHRILTGNSAVVASVRNIGSGFNPNGRFIFTKVTNNRVTYTLPASSGSQNYSPLANSLVIVNASRIGTTATITTLTPHGLSNGASVVITQLHVLADRVNPEGTFTVTIDGTNPNVFYFVFPNTSESYQTTGSPQAITDPGVSAPISSASRSSSAVTITTAAAHGFVTGQFISIVGLHTISDKINPEGRFQVTVVTTTVFSYTLTYADENYNFDNNTSFGCWHRLGLSAYGQGINNLNSTSLDVRWFGAIANESDCVPGVTKAFTYLNSQPGVKQYGALYFPGGTYYVGSKLVFDCAPMGNIGFTIKGDGPGATTLTYGMTAADTCLIEIKNATLGSFQDLSIQAPGYGGIVDSPSVVWIHDTTSFAVRNIQGLNLKSSARNGADGGIFRLGPTNDLVSMTGVVSVGSNSSGTVLHYNGGSGTISNCNFKGAGPTPCLTVTATNTLLMDQCFFQGGGPWKSFTGAAITATTVDFTVNKTAHGFLVGDYIVLTGAAKAGYNNRWKIATSSANSLTVISALDLGSDTVVLSSLSSCGYFGPKATEITESQMSGCFFNTGGSPGVGSVAMFLDAWNNGNIGQFSISNCLTDYGRTSVFAHGRPDVYYASNLGGLTILNQRQNTGAGDDFGGIRLEGVVNAVIDGCRQFPGDNVAPGTGKTFNCIVVSDGGYQVSDGTTYYGPRDITITGCNLSNRKSSTLYYASTVNALVFDGAWVYDVRVVNPGIDTQSSNSNAIQYINGALQSNGISVVYSNHQGLITGFSAGSMSATNINSTTTTVSIGSIQVLKSPPELNYPTGGSVVLDFGATTNIYIGLTANITFSSVNLSAGNQIRLALKNTTGGALSLSFPAWNWANVTAPTSLAAGASLVIEAWAYGLTNSTVFAKY
jgi:hypothetical protein